jgi:hypothetical protein
MEEDVNTAITTSFTPPSLPPSLPPYLARDRVDVQDVEEKLALQALGGDDRV